MINKYEDGASKQLCNNVLKKFLSKIDNLEAY